MVTVKLGQYLSSCPVEWHNFIRDLQQKNPEKPSDVGFTVTQLNKYLKPYGGSYHKLEHDLAAVKFSNEKKYTLFLLKYGSKE